MKRQTSIRDIKRLDIKFQTMTYKWIKGIPTDKFRLGTKSISLYEYTDYWKVISFTRGATVSNFTVQIFPKKDVEYMEYMV